MARTLTISDETAAVLDAEAARTKRPVDELVDEMVRRQLPAERAEDGEPFRIDARPMGVPAIDLDCTGRALEQLDAMERE